MQRIGPFGALKGVTTMQRMTMQRQPFADFMRERELALRRFGTVLTGDPRTSEEIVVDVLSRAWERWDHIGGLEQPNAYVRRMIVNEYLSSRRRLRRTAPRGDVLELLDQSDGHRPDHAHAQAERDDLDRRLARLPRQQRAVLVLRFYEDLPEAEIAALLGCTASTVRSNTARALAALRIHAQSDNPKTDLITKEI
jgi:RNA polymerase sigma-70 factor (sigma-E family)